MMTEQEDKNQSHPQPTAPRLSRIHSSLFLGFLPGAKCYLWYRGNAGSHICLSSKQLLLFFKMSVRSGLQTPVSAVPPRVPLVGPQRCACPLPPGLLKGVRGPRPDPGFPWALTATVLWDTVSCHCCRRTEERSWKEKCKSHWEHLLSLRRKKSTCFIRVPGGLGHPGCRGWEPGDVGTVAGVGKVAWRGQAGRRPGVLAWLDVVLPHL